MEAETTLTLDQIDSIRWAVSVAVPAISGLLGVVIGASLTGRREKSDRRLSFIEKQLNEFYSPMVGLRNEIAMRSKLRLRIQETAGTVWQELCAQAREVSQEELTELSNRRFPEFKRLIEHDNLVFRTTLFPAYQQMAKLFRDNYWLASPKTRVYYQELIEFLELWERWLAESIPVEIIRRLEHTEKRLSPFYAHLERIHDDLRLCIKNGEA